MNVFHQTILGLSTTSILLHLLKFRESKYVSIDELWKEKAASKLKRLESIYLPVYFLVFFADWLQGSYIYALYESRGYEITEIAYLFIIGFLSSGLIGPFVGLYLDNYGRRRGCIAFCILYSLSCLTKLSDDYRLLVVGRVTGGISTSLLQTAFESWFVSIATEQGIDEADLPFTFAKCTFINGISAILSGIVSYCLVEWFGLVYPFLLSTVVLIIAGIWIAQIWPDNQTKKSNKIELRWKEGIALLRSDRAFSTVYLVQTCFESSMYIFVFLWTPCLKKLTKDNLPLGIIFATFMVSIMIGSQLFSLLVQRKYAGVEHILAFSLLLSAGCFLGVVISKNVYVTFLFFNVFELGCGLYFPAISSFRTPHISEDLRSTVLNITRIPLNIIIVLVFTFVESLKMDILFIICAILCLLAQTALF